MGEYFAEYELTSEFLGYNSIKLKHVKTKDMPMIMDSDKEEDIVVSFLLSSSDLSVSSEKEIIDNMTQRDMIGISDIITASLNENEVASNNWSSEDMVCQLTAPVNFGNVIVTEISFHDIKIGEIIGDNEQDGWSGFTEFLRKYSSIGETPISDVFIKMLSVSDIALINGTVKPFFTEPSLSWKRL